MANRLKGHPSPYLEQHADNPVDWWPWCTEAFEEAAERDVPIFLSIGYATCHWCHVMAHESFEDADVAALMNDKFVCIKVDREERPDIDEAYMAICQAMTGRGGWPLTAILDHDKRAWFTGTYFPRTARGHHVGMMELVPKLAAAWQEKRDEIRHSAAHVLEHLAFKPSDAEVLPGDVADQARRGLMGRFDAEHGGFGSAPKFPSPHNLTLLLAGDDAKRQAALHTLDCMAAGGLHDHVGGGFHRYSTDSTWLLPHFEKMLYDQATMLDAYTQAWQVTKNPAYARVAEGIVTYVMRDLRHPDGAFYSAEDADSEGEEGTFYIWKHSELSELIGEQAAELGARPEGNFTDESTRQPVPANILHVPVGTDTASYADLFAKLLEVRSQRIRPLRDEKILTDWNGLFIDALARAAMAFNEPTWLDAAIEAAAFIAQHADGARRHRWRDGVVDEGAFLDDLAHFGNALVSLFEATGDANYLDAARPLAKQLLEQHLHERGFTTAPKDGFRLVVRMDAYDGAAPSGNSSAVRFLNRLGACSGDAGMQEVAASCAARFACNIRAQPSAYCAMLQARGAADVQVVVTSDALARIMWETHVPGAIRHHHRKPTGIEWLDAHNPAVPGGYVCQDFVCAEPAANVAEFTSRLAALSPNR